MFKHSFISHDNFTVILVRHMFHFVIGHQCCFKTKLSNLLYFILPLKPWIGHMFLKCLWNMFILYHIYFKRNRTISMLCTPQIIIPGSSERMKQLEFDSICIWLAILYLEHKFRNWHIHVPACCSDLWNKKQYSCFRKCFFCKIKRFFFLNK